MAETNGVTQECGRIVYIEPNDLLGSNVKYSQKLYDNNIIQDINGRVGDNITLCNEDLTMSVDLQVIMPGRDGLSCDSTSTILYTLTSDKEKMQSLMQGKTIEVKGISNNFLSTDYTNATYRELRKNGSGDTESLCIKSIHIKYDSHFYPIVEMVLTDVRGYALMMPSEMSYREYIAQETNQEYDANVKGSFFRALFHLPYPRFILTVKGYYGKPVTYNLCVSTFKTAFDSKTGDFNVTVSFIGYMYGLFVDLPFNLLLVAPYLSMEGWVNVVSGKEDKHGAFWDDKRFVFSDGKSIPTFIEFIRKMGSIKNLENHSENTAGSKELTSQEKLYNALGNLSSAITDFKNGYVSKKHTSCVHYSVDEQEDIYVFTKETKKEFKKAYLDSDNYNKMKTVFDKFWKEYDKDKSPLKDYGYVANSLTSTMPSKKEYINIDDSSLHINDKPTYTAWENDFGSSYTENVRKVVKDIYNANQNNRPYFVNEIFKGQVDIIEGLRKVVSARIKEMKEKKEEELSLITLQTLGFKPTIRNMFRMIFAHINAFTDSFYNLLLYISEQASERTLKYLGLNVQDTDVINSESTDSLRPFPLIYKKNENNVQEIVYPGTDERLCHLAEVIYVNDIVKSIFMVKSAIDDALKDTVYENEESLAEAISNVKTVVKRVKQAALGKVGSGTDSITDNVYDGGDIDLNSVNGKKSNNYNIVLFGDYHKSQNNHRNPYNFTCNVNGMSPDKMVWGLAFARYCCIRLRCVDKGSTFEKLVNAEVQNLKSSINVPTEKNSEFQDANIEDHYVIPAIKKLNNKTLSEIYDKGWAYEPAWQFEKLPFYIEDSGKIMTIETDKNDFPQFITRCNLPIDSTYYKIGETYKKLGIITYIGENMAVTIDSTLIHGSPKYQKGCMNKNNTYKINPLTICMPIYYMNTFLKTVKIHCPSTYGKGGVSIMLYPDGVFWKKTKGKTDDQVIWEASDGTVNMCATASWSTITEMKTGVYPRGNEFQDRHWCKILKYSEKPDNFYRTELSRWDHGFNLNKNLKNNPSEKKIQNSDYANKHIFFPYGGGGWKKYAKTKLDALKLINKTLGFKKKTRKYRRKLTDDEKRVDIVSGCLSGIEGLPMFWYIAINDGDNEFVNKLLADETASNKILDAFFNDTDFENNIRTHLSDKVGVYGSYDKKTKKPSEYDDIELTDRVVEKKSDGKYDEGYLLGRMLNYCMRSEKNKTRIEYLFNYYGFWSLRGNLDRLIDTDGEGRAWAPQQINDVYGGFKKRVIDKVLSGMNFGEGGEKVTKANIIGE